MSNIDWEQARTAAQIAAEAQAINAKEHERAEGYDLLTQARAHPLFKALQAATWPQIDGYIDQKFSALDADQKNVLKLLLIIGQAVLKERA